MTGLKDLSIWMWHRESSDGGECWRIHQAIETHDDPEHAADLARLRRIQQRTSSFRFLSIRPTLNSNLIGSGEDGRSFERVGDDERPVPAIHNPGAGDGRGRVRGASAACRSGASRLRESLGGPRG